MNALTMSPQDERDDAPGDGLPGRPRRRLFTRVTVPLLGILVAAAGFLGGIEVEKGHGGSAGGATALAGSSGATRGGFIRGARTGARTGATARGGFARAGGSGSSAGPPTGGFGGGGAGTGAGGGTTGTITSISGRTVDLKETSGTTIKVTLSSATSLKKDLSVTRNSIRPGDAVTVEGISGSGGSIKASSISDTGHASSTSTAG